MQPNNIVPVCGMDLLYDRPSFIVEQFLQSPVLFLALACMVGLWVVIRLTRRFRA